ncbi:MAG: hypothetical protein ACKO3N_13070, partial [Verrucomicrobiota bacterium]
MSKFTARFKSVQEKAAQIKKLVDAAPAKTAQLRDAVNATTGQLQVLRTEVESTMAALRADTEDSLAETLVQLDQHLDLLDRAGYELAGVDVEQGAVPRVLLHVDQLPTARSSPLEALRIEAGSHPLLQALLGALIRAEEMEERLELTGLVFTGLVVHIGPVPTVRLCWRRAQEVVEETPTTAASVPAMATPPPLPTTPSPAAVSGTGSALGSYESGSFFGRTTPPAPATRPRETESSVPAAPATPPSGARATPEPAPSTGDWRKDALARFKKMPDLSAPRGGSPGTGR